MFEMIVAVAIEKLLLMATDHENVEIKTKNKVAAEALSFAHDSQMAFYEYLNKVEKYKAKEIEQSSVFSTSFAVSSANLISGSIVDGQIKKRDKIISEALEFAIVVHETTKNYHEALKKKTNVRAERTPKNKKH